MQMLTFPSVRKGRRISAVCVRMEPECTNNERRRKKAADSVHKGDEEEEEEEDNEEEAVDAFVGFDNTENAT